MQDHSEVQDDNGNKRVDRVEKLILVINAGSSSIKFQLFETSIPIRFQDTWASAPTSSEAPCANKHCSCIPMPTERSEQRSQADYVVQNRTLKEDGYIADPMMLYKGQMDAIYIDPIFTAKDVNDAKTIVEKLSTDQVGNHDCSLHYILNWLETKTLGKKISAIGHRVVHGGTRFSKPVRITEQIITDLESLIPLAPLHQLHNITPIKLFNRLLPDALQVACFDTAFHTTQPELQQLIALPYKLVQKEGIRRYGFHGLSYAYLASVLPQWLPQAAMGKVIACHLGNGSSMTALQACKSYATTMAFTAVEGLPMGTRTGTLDPGVLLYCLNHLKMDVKQIEDLIYKQSGLLGISGVSSDMRELHASTDSHAKMAVDFFCMRIAREAASLAAALQGFDALIFTAGIGENDHMVRADVCRQLAWLGVDLDLIANAQQLSGPRRISTPKSKVEVWIIPTNEELMIARAALEEMGQWP